MKKLSLFILLVVLSLCLCACEITEETDPLDSIKVTAVAGVEVKANSVTLTQSQYNALKSSPAENCDYTLYNGVTAQVSVNEN